MSSINIYSILKSKPHNKHYLNKYWNFIQNCVKANVTLDINTAIEHHHIAPKASDLFPEFACSKTFPWNIVKLTCRQHIIAHVMLWKTYGGSQTFALDYMINRGNNCNKNVCSSRNIPNSINIRYSAKLKEFAIKMQKGFATYKDKQGIKYYLHNTDPLIEQLNLVGNNIGKCHSDTAKQRMSKAKYPNKKVKIYFLTFSTTVKLFSEEFHNYICQGWNTYKTEDDKKYVSEQRSERIIKRQKGKARYMYQDGTFYGYLDKSDPKINELNLFLHFTENHKQQQKLLAKKAVEFNTGSKIYNNGVEERKFKENVPKGWTLGRLPKSKSHDENQKAAAIKANSDTYMYNNGVICKRFKIGVDPGEGWVRGMLPRKSKK